MLARLVNVRCLSFRGQFIMGEGEEDWRRRRRRSNGRGCAKRHLTDTDFGVWGKKKSGLLQISTPQSAVSRSWRWRFGSDRNFNTRCEKWRRRKVDSSLPYHVLDVEVAWSISSFVECEEKGGVVST